jgi:jumonji domain-containing protein 2
MRMADLECLFWKRIGPTMPPAWYGADEEGSFFGDDDASGWAVNKLDSCLHLLSNVPGVTTPYLYLGMWGACFAAHTEDINLLSINYLHAGAPKVWYAIAPGRDARRFEELAAFHYRQSENICKEFLRHKRSLLSPRILQKAGIPFTTMAQYPGDAMITFPGGYHFGFNTGYNVAEATNFGVPEWIPFGLRANVCLCRPDSVRIDVKRFIHVLKQYAVYAERQRRKGKRAQILSHKEWAETRQREKEEAEKKNASPETDSKKRKRNPTVQQQRKEFYVEVMKPSLPKKSSSAKKNGRSRGQKQSSIMTQKSDDVWHLAKPVCRKDLKVDDPVLVLLPAMVDETPKKKVWKRWNESSDEDDDDEEAEDLCFAGVIAEISDGHVRIHLKGLPKSEDVWTPINSSKFFVDGGQWRDQKDQALPELHYWKECDTKTLTA